MCGIPSLCRGPYLGITVVSAIVSTAFLSAKACLSNTFDSRNGISPVVAAAVERERRLGFPLLLILSAIFALVHIVVACKSRCPARRKLTFFLTDAESVAICKIGGNTYPRNLPLFRKLDLDCRSILGGKYDSDKDVPARMIADKQSLFMDL